MTTMDYTKTMQALRRLKVETGSLACLSCRHGDDCSIHGCTIIRNAVEYMEAGLSNYNHLNALVDKQAAEIKVWAKDLAASEEARAELGRRLAATSAEALRASGWISVKDRLPEAGKVLVTDGKAVIISNGAWLYRSPEGKTRVPANYGAGLTVTHWMPLPEPPEGERHE